MQYKLKSVTPIGKPKTQNIGLPPVEKYGINIIITTEIVGQVYNGFTKSDAMFFELDKADSIDENEVKMNAFATNYVATKYPNT